MKISKIAHINELNNFSVEISDKILGWIKSLAATNTIKSPTTTDKPIQGKIWGLTIDFDVIFDLGYWANNPDKRFSIDSGFSHIKNSIYVKIVFTRKPPFTKTYSEFKIKLPDVIRHEVEHYIQTLVDSSEEKRYTTDNFAKKPNTIEEYINNYFEYLNNQNEIDAFVKGFMLLAKRTGENFRNLILKELSNKICTSQFGDLSKTEYFPDIKNRLVQLVDKKYITRAKEIYGQRVDLPKKYKK